MKHTLICLVLIGSSTLGRAASPHEPQPFLQRLWSLTFQAQKRDVTNATRKGPIDVVFVGDSLTQLWMREGSAIWDLEFAALNCVNFGISGDRTEHILFRTSRADFERHPIKRFVLLAGTNNLWLANDANSPAAVLKGVEAIVASLRKASPDAQISLLTLPPNGVDPESDLNRRVSAFNKLLRETQFADNIAVIDFHQKCIDEDDAWLPGLTTDGTHLSQSGYELFASAVLADEADDSR